jgi:hypothetical protein
VNGRQYFRALEERLHIEDLDPAALAEREYSGLKRGPAQSRIGGRLTVDLKRLTPEEVGDRRRRSEEFLQMPRETFPDETDEE